MEEKILGCEHIDKDLALKLKLDPNCDDSITTFVNSLKNGGSEIAHLCSECSEAVMTALRG